MWKIVDVAICHVGGPVMTGAACQRFPAKIDRRDCMGILLKGLELNWQNSNFRTE